MARRKLHKGSTSSPATAPSKTVDGFQNLEAKVGFNASNMQGSSTYTNDFISRNRQVLESAYRTSWISAAAVNAVADDMTREGVSLIGDIDVDVEENISRQASRLQIWNGLNSTIRWARLYGGAIGFLMIDGQNPETPLNMETIAKGQFKGIFPMDRWMLQPNLNDLITDMSADIGKPKCYNTIQDQNYGLPRMNIHYSRVIRIEGMELPYYQRIAENGWAQSVLECMWDRLIAFDSTTEGAAQLVYKAHLRTMTVEGLRDIISSGGRQLDALTQQMDMVRRFQSNEGLTLVDDHDKFEAHSYSFAGLADMVGVFAEQVSGALGIPLVRLFGQTPRGLNATGDSEIRSYYDNVRQQQEVKLRTGTLKVYELLYRSVTGEAPPSGFDIEFSPLWTPSDLDKANINSAITNSITAASDSGLIDSATALKELRQSASITGVWTSITDEQITEAEDEPPPNMEMNGEETESSQAKPSGEVLPKDAPASGEASREVH